VVGFPDSALQCGQQIALGPPMFGHARQPLGHKGIGEKKKMRTCRDSGRLTA
jgi:hypothetical protein